MKSNYGAADRSFMRGKGPSHCLPERKRVPTILLCEVFIMQAQRRPRGGGNYMASRSLWSKLKGFMITLQLISYSCSWTCLGDVLPPVLKWQLQPEMTMHKGKDIHLCTGGHCLSATGPQSVLSFFFPYFRFRSVKCTVRQQTHSVKQKSMCSCFI